MSAHGGGSGPPTLMATSTGWSEAGCECMSARLPRRSTVRRNVSKMSVRGNRQDFHWGEAEKHGGRRKPHQIAAAATVSVKLATLTPQRRRTRGVESVWMSSPSIVAPGTSDRQPSDPSRCAPPEDQPTRSF